MSACRASSARTASEKVVEIALDPSEKAGFDKSVKAVQDLCGVAEKLLKAEGKL